MTKLESGAVVPNLFAARSREIVGSALRRAARSSMSASRRARSGAEPADAGARCGAVRAGAVQPARQCREICPGRHHDRDPGPYATAIGLAAGAGRGAGIPPGDLEQRVRQVLSRPERATTFAPAPGSALRSPAASSRQWAAPSSATNRADRSGAVLTIRLPIPAGLRSSGHRRMSRRPDQGPGDR
jgi:two-component system sensor histidine kinase KdpD